MEKSVLLWSPTNGKQSFPKEHAANLLKMQIGRPIKKQTWFEYDGQDKAKGSEDNLSNQDNVDNVGDKGNSKKGNRPSQKRRK